jgi:hypothetical protein
MAVFPDHIDKGTADHDSLGMAGDFGSLFRVGNAEPDTDGEGAHLADHLHLVLHVGGD